jgi:hypothetical protein
MSTTNTLGSSVAANSDGGMTTLWLFTGKLNAADRNAMNAYLNNEWQLGLTL